MARKPSGPPPKSKRPAPSSEKSAAAKMVPAKMAVAAGPELRTVTPDAPRKRVSLIEFAAQVRAEARKITWTTWRETWITSIMVFAMVLITGLFFLIVDQIMSHGMQFLLQLAA
jgi:preprotein translocase subunit SecE